LSDTSSAGDKKVKLTNIRKDGTMAPKHFDRVTRILGGLWLVISLGLAIPALAQEAEERPGELNGLNQPDGGARVYTRRIPPSGSL
jgi:preprotein translocase subunit SecG